MKIILAGMTPQEGAAMSSLIGKTLTRWTCDKVATLAELSTASANCSVLDLPGLGMSRYSEALASTLFQALKGGPAIVIIPLHDQSWSTLETTKPVTQSLIYIRKPYKANDMRHALEQLLAQNRVAPAPQGIAKPLKAMPPKIEPVQETPAAVATPATNPEIQMDDEGVLSVQEFVTHASPSKPESQSLFLRKLTEALLSGMSFEIRFTLQHSMVVCPEESWVASNTPSVIIQRLLHSDGLASVVQFRKMSGAAGLQMAKRHNMSFQPLGIFLWDLLHPVAPGEPVKGKIE